ncbi:HAD family hydrolase [Tahibacter amnicola]|uniref:HAD family hydrolase n=1 Tax=Tahibacter amnicola TaxID=2976241 RepID=A0ABY6BQ73_9GAMM|nr:HAD family hydrolase [Tahibacter amnicola]UXI70570.1 HAD family hydrolase [Tahibacter amnicola]
MPELTARKLLVLDLDETLVYATEIPLGHPEDFRVGPYYVYPRPHLTAFLADMQSLFDIGVWTASGERYAIQIVQRYFAPESLAFVWSSERCTLARDLESGNYLTLKNLKKLRRRGYLLEQIIAVDDTPSKYRRSYGNLVTVSEFTGDPGDAELPLLGRYLRSLAGVPNVRQIEKRRWRQQVAHLP